MELGNAMDTILVNSIESITRKRLATIGDSASLIEVAKLLSDPRISVVVVCSSEGVMVGVITMRNVVQSIGQSSGSAITAAAAEVMTRDVRHCHPTDTLEDVILTMKKHGLVHLPIADENARPTGVVDARDAFRALVAQADYNASLLREYIMGVGYG
jgi:CBS domain-containing protein